MQVTIAISIASIVFLVLSYLCLPLGTTKVIFLQMITFFAVVSLLKMSRPKIQSFKVIKGERLEEERFNMLQKGFYQFKPYRSSQAKAADHD